MRALFIFLLLCLSCVGQELRSYAVNPQFIHHLVHHTAYTTAENSDPFSIYSDDPFADHFGKIKYGKMVAESHPQPSSLYLTRIKAPILAEYFEPTDRVYDARKLFEKYKIITKADGWILYNVSKQQLHVYKLLEGNLDKLATAYLSKPTTQLHTTFSLNNGTDTHHQSIYHQLDQQSELTIADHTVAFVSKRKQGESVLTQCTISPGGIQKEVNVTGSLQLSPTTTLKLQTTELELAQRPPLSPLPVILPEQKVPVVEKKPEVPVLSHIHARSRDIQYLMEMDVPALQYTQDDPFAPRDQNTLSAIHDNKNTLTIFSPVKMPNIPGVCHEDDLCIDITDALSASGVEFGNDGWAVYNYTQSQIISFCTPTNADVIEQLFIELCCGCSNPRNIATHATLVKLPSREEPYSYAELITQPYVILSSAHVVGRSGEKAITSIRNAKNDTVPYELEVEPTLGEDGYHIDARVSLLTPQLEYNSLLTVADGKPIAVPLYQDGTDATYLLIHSSIKTLKHHH